MRCACMIVCVCVCEGGGGWVGDRERRKWVKCKQGGIRILLVRSMIYIPFDCFC